MKWHPWLHEIFEKMFSNDLPAEDKGQKISMTIYGISHCGILAPYSDSDIGQQWRQFIIWSNADLLLIDPFGNMLCFCNNIDRR